MLGVAFTSCPTVVQVAKKCPPFVCARTICFHPRYRRFESAIKELLEFIREEAPNDSDFDWRF